MPTESDAELLLSAPARIVVVLALLTGHSPCKGVIAERQRYAARPMIDSVARVYYANGL